MKRRIVLLAISALLFSVTAFPADIPEGFTTYKLRKGDFIGKIAPTSEQQNIIKKVNRIDERHFRPNKTIIVPTDLEKARKFVPVPEQVAEISQYARALMVFLDTQYSGAYENGTLVLWGPVCSGKNGKTPKGTFHVLWKSKDYVSKKYDVKMPYAVNFSSAGFFFHEQSLTGRPSSHGCVRSLREDAAWVFGWIKKNDTVIVN